MLIGGPPWYENYPPPRREWICNTYFLFVFLRRSFSLLICVSFFILLKPLVMSFTSAYCLRKRYKHTNRANALIGVVNIIITFPNRNSRSGVIDAFHTDDCHK